MVTTAQWVAYRYAERAMLRAPLPSASDAGGGWRSVELRRHLPLDQLDMLVAETARKVGAALAIASDDAGFSYVVASDEEGSEARLVLDPDAAAGSDAGREALARADAETKASDRWRRRSARAFAEWSAATPSAIDDRQVAEVMSGDRQVDAIADLVGALGVRLPEAHPPSHTELHEVARVQAPS